MRPVALTYDLIGLIDDARRRGQSYDEVVDAVQKHTGQPPEITERLLQEYRRIPTTGDGRTREQVNLGDPSEGPYG